MSTFADYGGFSREYFTGDHPAGYTNYRPQTIGAGEQAELIHDVMVERSVEENPVLIVGCGYGFSIKILVEEYDVDAYGLDVSDFAIQQSPIEVSGRLCCGDILHVEDIGPFGSVISEKVLPCFDDDSANRACEKMRELSESSVVHILPSELNEEFYNTKPLSEWREICDPDGLDIWVRGGL